MNTVLSAVALDYPPEKLAVYLSNDGGSPVSLYAIKEACLFARSWFPFCRKYGIKTRCPEAYFSSFCDDERLVLLSDNSRVEEENIRSMYELFKKNVESVKCGGVEGSVMQDRPPLVEVSNPWFVAFAAVYAPSTRQHLYDVLSTGESFRTWWNEQRMWVMKSITGSLFGCLDALITCLGIARANFRLTNKAIDRKNLEEYKRGKFNFQGAETFMIPLITLAVLNMECLVGGAIRMMRERMFEEMLGQVFICSWGLLLSYPILEGIMLGVCSVKCLKR